MSYEESKSALRALIEERAWMVRDAQVFVWAKCEGRKAKLDEDRIGGGNFLVVIGMFAVLNFLSKAFYLLQDDAATWSETEVRTVKRALRNCPDAMGASPPFIGSPKKSEKDCFVDFADAMEYPLIAGEHEMEQNERRNIYGLLWDSYRNKLAHMAMPGQPISSIGDYSTWPYSEVKVMLEGNTDPAFVKKDEVYVPITDLLSRDIQKWVWWLNAEIDSNRFSESRVNAVIEWVRA